MKAKIKYVSADCKKISLFGGRFSEKHNSLTYIYKSQEYNIKSFRKRKLKVMEIEINWEKLSDLSYLFYRSDIKEFIYLDFDTENVYDMTRMFCQCLSLKVLPDCISKWNTKNLIYMYKMFSHSSLLKYIPDLSKWSTDNVVDMGYLFGECYRLIQLPDISNWKTSKVKKISGIFLQCDSLMFLPDISKWDTSKVKFMRQLFWNCCSLVSLPDISKWNTSEVEYMEEMFYGCESLKYIRDISKWNTEKVKRMDHMFSHCKSLSILPDLSKWNLKSLESAYNMFTYCTSLTSFPNLNFKKNVANCEVTRESINLLNPPKINNDEDDGIVLLYQSHSEGSDFDEILDEDEIQNRIKNLDEDDDIVLRHLYERFIYNDDD